jgi:hypothetical protein
MAIDTSQCKRLDVQVRLVTGCTGVLLCVFALVNLIVSLTRAFNAQVIILSFYTLYVRATAWGDCWMELTRWVMVLGMGMGMGIGLDWVGLDWVGLDWIGLDWIGLDWIGLDWLGLGWEGWEGRWWRGRRRRWRGWWGGRRS